MERKINLDANAERAFEAILEAWRHPENLPEKMARVFLPSTVKDRWSRRWSERNQCIMVLCGYSDAATFRKWKERGRRVRKGQHGFQIVRPVMRKFPLEFKLNEDGSRAQEGGRDVVTKWGSQLTGFTGWTVFGIEQTEVEDPELDAKYVDPEAAARAQEYLEALPLRDLAEKWGLSITAGSRNGVAYGWFEPAARNITVCVEGFQTWLHELAHASEEQRGVLVKGRGQDPGNEISAEMAALILMHVLGYGEQADTRRTYEYVANYMNSSEDQLQAGYRLMGRIMDCVKHILVEAGLAEAQAPEEEREAA